MHEISIEGLVSIVNGDKTIKCENTLVGDALQHFHVWNALDQEGGDGGNVGVGRVNIGIGSDTSTSTSYDTTALSNVISTSPNNITGETADDGSNNVYDIIVHGTWNAGTVSGTLGEAGLYLGLYLFNSISGFPAYPSPSTELFSRACSADGDFSSFTIDDTKPLTIDWTIRFEFV